MYFTDSHGKYMVWMYSVIAHLISLISISFRYVTYIQRMASGSRKRKRIAFSLDLSPVGISLTSESCCNQDGQQHHHANLGFILVNPEDTVVNDLRGVIGNQLETVPVNYRFLTKQGWPVRPKQEAQIKACHLVTKDGLIRIQRDFGEPRVGVVCETGTALGFVFMSSLQLTINKLRQAVLAQSKDVAIVLTGPSSSQPSQDSNKIDPTLPESSPCSLGSMRELLHDDWVFLDRNGWPVNRQQESTLTILDILVQSSVKVRVHSSEFRGQSGLMESHGSFTSTMAEFGLMNTPPSKMQKVSKSPNNLTSLDDSFNYSPHKMRPRSPLTTNPDSPFTSKAPISAKQILISYVRAEATQYALDLKTELEMQKFSVYLDVHEIFCGTDWQDSLNFAVSNCAVFVPLVTPRYGETQWTNREVKLADVLGKYILPVSFLETWPPRCLAIQFATTQFINWRKPKPGQPATPHSPSKELSMDSSFKKCYEWEKKDVVCVAKDIGKRCQSKRINNVTNGVAPLARGKTLSVGDILNEGREDGDSLLVISTHPKQEEFGAELKKLFESKGYDVWITTELSRMNGTDTESDGTLILEGNEDAMDGVFASNPATLFQEKVNEASVVLFVLSKAFAESATCKGQVFYCEQRKRVVSLAYEDFEMPGWMSMLIGTSTFENVRRADYKDHLLARLAEACDPATLIDAEDIAKEKQVSVAVEFVCKNLPDTGCVYIAGGTKYYYDKSQAICKAIGVALAKLPTVTLITGGFFGVGHDVSKSFYDERKKLRMEHRVWHILPKKDERDCTVQANQRPDKSFQGPPFGKTLHCGESVRQRESIVSKVFDICIIVEGGPGAAHEAEEFTWSDHTVIPIKCTGGAAGGKFKVPHKIFELPPGVARDDWQLLSNKTVSAVEIGAAVARIVRALQEGVISQVTCQKSFRQRPTLTRGKSMPFPERT
ncbi:uncharacterized protein LOC763292 isoform X2 [Strongylocentrotus purpuratus]|uniref:TIR domain-containing protein n=1 Tax=Strongylocentrotus purpuratus TaxID=7668 RepID=A0A7M7NTY5_STRPU|nr:uncharacterized protein LOC763292 isoform X2 [Strongylocentrotus purpuratus]